MSQAMQYQYDLHEQIHARALALSGRYLNAEAELIDVLQQVEQHKVFLRKKYSSLFQYVVRELHLSESVAYNLITVSRKAKDVPELKAEIQKGNITLSNAKKIAPVLTINNQEEWLKKARELSQRQLEREIVKIRPEAATPERASYISINDGVVRIKLELGLPEKEMLRLRRTQDLLSQARKTAVSLEETLITITNEYLRQNDPIEKAKRHVVRKGVLNADFQNNNKIDDRNKYREEFKRESIPAAMLHHVNLRDQRQCTFVMSDGIRCNQSRWIEIHHKIPVSHGGKNEVNNLATLCSSHHALTHLQISKKA